MKKRVGFLLLPLMASACTTATTNRFKSFAELGRGFETAVDRVIDQAASLNADANSQALIIGRKDTPDARRADLRAHNTAILEANRLYADLKKQNAILSEYFIALGALASFDGESAIGASTQGLVSQLQTLSPRLQNVSIGEAPISNVVGAAVPIIVSNVKSARLRTELQRNGGVIAQQLDLQSQVLETLAEDIALDQRTLTQSAILEQIYKPYINGSSVPAGWIADRRELLMQQALAPAPAKDAAELSRKLKLAFLGLAEGRIEPSDLADHAAHLGRLMNLIEMVAKPGGEGK